MDIYISYSHKSKEFVRRLSSDLRENEFSVWIDEDIISAGEKWSDKITETIEQSDIVLVVLSKDSLTSSFQSSELAYAIASQRKKLNKKVIPLLLDKAAELPFFLKDVVYIDFSENEKYKERFVLLLQALSKQHSVDNGHFSSDRRKIDAIKAEKEFLILEREDLAKKTNIWFSTVMGTIASVIAVLVTFLAGAIASKSWLVKIFNDWGDFLLGVLVGSLGALAGFLVSRQVQHRSLKKEMGDGK